jgi:hypothetical protein
MGPKPATVACLYSESGLSRPAAAAALAIGPCRIDFFGVLQRHPRRLPSAGLSNCRQVDIEFREVLAAPTRVECPLTSSTNLAGVPIHCATRLKIGATLPGCRASVDINILCHLIPVVTVIEGFWSSVLFLMKFLVPLDLASQNVDALGVLYFRSDRRKHAFYQ